MLCKTLQFFKNLSKKTKGGIQKTGSSVDQARITSQAAFFISEK